MLITAERYRQTGNARIDLGRDTRPVVTGDCAFLDSTGGAAVSERIAEYNQQIKSDFEVSVWPCSGYCCTFNRSYAAPATALV